jgi:TMEM175 potassium channel family protein
MYPKSRIDGLTDGIFGVAMTILVLDVRLPDTFHSDPTGLVAALKDLWPKFLPYVLSFYVLGSTWLANIKLRSTAESVGKRYVSSWLLYLFIANCLPFSTSVVGQFARLKPAVWLYAANMAALAAVGYRLVVLLPGSSDDDNLLDRKLSLSFLMGTSALCTALSPISPSKALWVYLLNLGEPLIARWMTLKRNTGSVDKYGGTKH